MCPHKPGGSKQRTPSVRKGFLARPQTKPVAEKKFDPESGLIYSEIEVRPNRNKHADWTREFSTPHVVSKPATNARGARSLKDIASAKAVKEFHSLTTEHFAGIPWPLAEIVWNQTVAAYEFCLVQLSRGLLTAVIGTERPFMPGERLLQHILMQ